MSTSRQVRRASARQAEKKRTPGNSVASARTPMQAVMDLMGLVDALAHEFETHDKRLAALELRAGLRVPAHTGAAAMCEDIEIVTTDAVVPTEPVVGVPYCDVVPDATAPEEVPHAN